MRCLFVLAILVIASQSGCKPLQINPPRDRILPSNHRQWSPELAKMPVSRVLENGRVEIKNIRNCEYVSTSDFVTDYYDREISMDEIQSVDFIVVPFNATPSLAHTMLSFELSDGTYIAASIETRREQGEKFNAALGTSRQFELIYVLADERDVIRLRTRHRKSDVYVYPTVASPEAARKLFVDVLDRANKLAKEPEFYHSFTNNCTTNLAGHVNQVADDRILNNWRVLLPGFSDRYAYELELLPQSVPFEDLRAIARVNELAEQYYDEPDFSRRIRTGRGRLERLVQRERDRRPLPEGTVSEQRLRR